MKDTRLGCSEVEVSPVVLGTMSLPTAEAHWAESQRIVHAALELGITTIDTAPLYGFGRCDELIASAIRDWPSQVCLLTKVGLRWNNDAVAQAGCPPRGRVHFAHQDELGRTRVVHRDSRPESIRMEVDASLQRLGVECLDLVQVHFRDVDTPVGETIGALEDLRAAGKLRAIGVSNFTVGETLTAQRALSTAGLASHQLEYNLVDREMEDVMLPEAVRLGLGVLTYSPLRRGLLAGRMEKLAEIKGPRTREFLKRALATLQELAAARAQSPGVLALAWLLKQPAVSAVISGASSAQQVRDNAAAIETSLSDEEEATLRRAFVHCDGSLDWSLKQRGRGLLRRWRRKLFS